VNVRHSEPPPSYSLAPDLSADSRRGRCGADLLGNQKAPLWLAVNIVQAASYGVVGVSLVSCASKVIGSRWRSLGNRIRLICALITADPDRKVYPTGPAWKCRSRPGSDRPEGGDLASGTRGYEIPNRVKGA